MEKHQIDTLINHWKSQDVQAQREYIQKINQTIINIDNMPKEDRLEFMGKRNLLVMIKNKIKSDLPFLYQIGEEVQVRSKQTIQAIIVQHYDYEKKWLLVKPIHSVYKDFVVSEDLVLKINEEI